MSEVDNLAEREFYETWGRTRLLGRRRFALIHGVVIWGGLMVLGLVGGSILFHKFHIVAAGLQAAVSVAGGYLVGIKMWDANERRFAL